MRLDAIFYALPELETDRLLLRRLVRSDARDMFAYAADPEVARHVLWEAHKSLSESRQAIRYMRRLYRMGAPCSWAIVWKETGQMIGTIGYSDYSPEHRTVEIGYSLARSFWGRGIATEALMAVRNFTFDQSDLYRLQALVEDGHTASCRVLEKCGFRCEGVLRGRINNKGHQSDVRIYGLLRQDL